MKSDLIVGYVRLVFCLAIDYTEYSVQLLQCVTWRIALNSRKTCRSIAHKGKICITGLLVRINEAQCLSNTPSIFVLARFYSKIPCHFIAILGEEHLHWQSRNMINDQLSPLLIQIYIDQINFMPGRGNGRHWQSTDGCEWLSYPGIKICRTYRNADRCRSTHPLGRFLKSELWNSKYS